MIYTDIDEFVCAWLRELIADGQLKKGGVLCADVRDLRPDDLVGHETVHLFAGIGGWALALDLANWRDLAWTVSCPCPPFSVAGNKRCPRCGEGLAFYGNEESCIAYFGCWACGWLDDRHLWPAVRRIIAECRPPTLFGEQVASRVGREWLAGVRADLEALGYAVGAADLCAAGVGAPHKRQRLFWVADATARRRGSRKTPQEEGAWSNDARSDIRLGNTDGWGRGFRRQQNTERNHARGAEPDRPGAAALGNETWEIILCGDGRYRRAPTEPRLFPVVDARDVCNRVAALRGAGNAVVPQLAAEFVRCAFETTRSN